MIALDMHDNQSEHEGIPRLGPFKLILGSV